MTARDVLAAYADRINRQDFDLLTDLVAPDATFWFSDGTHRGIDAIRAAFEATWQIMGLTSTTGSISTNGSPKAITPPPASIATTGGRRSTASPLRARAAAPLC
jgi:hypothetical protein